MRYTNITLDEMRDFLKFEKGWIETVTGKEVLFSYKLKSAQNIEILVYSGIKAQNGQSRGCGDDAIRVCAVDRKENRGFIKTSRVYRVEGWKVNLENRVLEVICAAKERLKQLHFKVGA